MEKFPLDDSEFTRLSQENLDLNVYNPQEKEMDPVKVNFNPGSWKIKTYERSRDRMKITIKLSGEEAEAWKNFALTIKPDQMLMDDFIKAMFLTGISSTNEKLAKAVADYSIAHKEELEVSGITVDTEGDIPIIKTFDVSGGQEDGKKE